MKTTLNISDATWRELKREAARRGQTMTELVEAALRLFLRDTGPDDEPPPLPAFSSGGARVDIANRDALYDEMER